MGSQNPIGFLLGIVLSWMTARDTNSRRSRELRRVERFTVLDDAHHQRNGALVMRAAPHSRHKLRPQSSQATGLPSWQTMPVRTSRDVSGLFGSIVMALTIAPEP